MCFSWISTDTSLELKSIESNECRGVIIVRLSADDISAIGDDPQHIYCDIQLSHQNSNVNTNQLLRLLALEAGTSISANARAHHSSSYHASFRY